RQYNREALETAEKLKDFEALTIVNELVKNNSDLQKKLSEVKGSIPESAFKELEILDSTIEQYKNGTFAYSVRGKEIKVKTQYRSLSQNDISKVAFPKFNSLFDKY